MDSAICSIRRWNCDDRHHALGLPKTCWAEYFLQWTCHDSRCWSLVRQLCQRRAQLPFMDCNLFSSHLPFSRTIHVQPFPKKWSDHWLLDWSQLFGFANRSLCCILVCHCHRNFDSFKNRLRRFVGKWTIQIQDA